MSESHESRARADSAEIAFRKIFIGGLSYSTDEEKLKKYFQVYGTVQDAVVMKDPVSKRSRGFGFITFYDISSVDNVLAHEPHTIDQRKVEAKRAVPRSEIAKEASSAKSYVPSSGSTPTKFSTPTSSPQIGTPKSNSSPTNSYSDGKFSGENKVNLEDYTYNKIFVGGLHYDTRDPEFKSYFEKYGRVISAEVMFNRETHKSRGFGFIVFEAEDSAIRVCNEKEHVIDGKVVEVKRAIPRSKIFNSNGTSIQVSADDSPTSITNIRSDVRRTMSTGSAQFLTSTSSILSSNSSTLAASTVVQKGLQSSSIPTQRKPFSTAVSPPTTTSKTTPTSGSYAAALKVGGSGEDDTKTEFRSLLSSNISSNSLSAMDTTQSTTEQNTENDFSDLNALLRQSRLETVRTVRALSEPIVKFDGSAIFGKDVFGMELHPLGASTPPNSLNSSRSSSIYITNQNLGGLFSSTNDSTFNGNLNSNAGLSTMPWLSSPSTAISAFDGSVDNSSLLSLSLPPPISASKSENPQVSPGVIGTANISGNTDSQHSFMQFPVGIDSENSKSKSLFSTPPRNNGISLLSDSAQKSHVGKSNESVVPSPEKWAAMFGVSGSQVNNGFLNLLTDQSWPDNDIFSNNFQDSSLFGEFDSNSRVLGIASTSLRSGTTTTESSEGFSTSNNTRRNSHPSVPMPSEMDAFDVNAIAQYSDLRLDSQEFIPQGSSLWNSVP